MVNSDKKTSPEKALLKMSDLCARSEQCEADIRQKLYRMGLTSSEVQSVVSRLIADGFIDNSRFARCFARYKVRFCGWGRRKIRLGLMAKRMSSSDISEALESIEQQDYLDALRRVAATKAKGMDLTGEDARDNRLKLFRHLISRGFESEQASEAIREIIRKVKE